MRVIATADWQQIQSLRWKGKDNLAAIDQLIGFAEQYKPDVILHGGDLFDSRSPSVSDRRELVKRIKTLVGISPVIVSLGNHDISAEYTSIDDIIELAIPWLYIPRRPQIVDFPDFSVLVFPWLYPKHIGIERRFSSEKERSQSIANIVDSVISAIATKLDHRKKRLLVAHATAFNAKYGEHRDTVLGDDIIWRPDWWKPFDFVCLGHIHRPQLVNADPPVVYPGSLERMTYGEWQEEKGFYTWDSESGVEFHKVCNRPMFVLDGTPDQVIESAHGLPEGSMVKCKVSLEHGENFVLPDPGRFIEVIIEPRYPKHERARLSQDIASGKTPPELMELYLQSIGKTDKEIETLFSAWRKLDK